MVRLAGGFKEEFLDGMDLNLSPQEVRSGREPTGNEALKWMKDFSTVSFPRQP